MNAKWNPAVFAIAWMWSLGVRSLLFLGIAGCCPTLKLGIAWGNVKVGSRSGLFARLRYRVHQLVSTVSCMRFVNRGFPLDPVAVLPGKVANGLRSTISARFEAKYALMKFWWVNS